MTKLNLELLNETMQFIEDNPDKHNQRTYRSYVPGCGTVACFAGWSVMLAGYKEVDTFCDWFVWDVGPEKRVVSIPELAKQVLGLSSAQSYKLFYQNRTVEELKLMVKELNNDPESDLIANF